MSAADPSGVVMLLISADGRVIASATDFKRDAPGGYSRKDAQEFRCKRELHAAVMRAFASDVLANAIDAYQAEAIVRRLCHESGHRIHTIHIGADES